MINSLREYFLKCPSFQKLKELGVDMLSKDANVATIDKTPIKPILRTKVNGDTERQASFILRAHFNHSNELQNKLKNSEFFEEIAEWIEEQNEEENFPILKNNQYVTKITISSSDYLVSVDPTLRKACYQIQIIVEYTRKDVKNPFVDFFV